MREGSSGEGRRVSVRRRVCVCVRERERDRVCEWVSGCACVCERERSAEVVHVRQHVASKGP